MSKSEWVDVGLAVAIMVAGFLSLVAVATVR